jgi:hypothetical protein
MCQRYTMNLRKAKQFLRYSEQALETNRISCKGNKITSELCADLISRYPLLFYLVNMKCKFYECNKLSEQGARQKIDLELSICLEDLAELLVYWLFQSIIYGTPPRPCVPHCTPPAGPLKFWAAPQVLSPLSPEPVAQLFVVSPVMQPV